MDLSLCGAAEDDPEAVFDVMKSFPSGHAQMSSFTASFLIVYMSNRLHSTHSNLLKLWFHFVIFGLTMYSCTSRVKDHRHHVSDIVVGAALGAGLGIATAMDHWKEVVQSKSISSKGNIGIVAETKVFEVENQDSGKEI